MLKSEDESWEIWATGVLRLLLFCFVLSLSLICEGACEGACEGVLAAGSQMKWIKRDLPIIFFYYHQENFSRIYTMIIIPVIPLKSARKTFLNLPYNAFIWAQSIPLLRTKYKMAFILHDYLKLILYLWYDYIGAWHKGGWGAQCPPTVPPPQTNAILSNSLGKIQGGNWQKLGKW